MTHEPLTCRLCGDRHIRSLGAIPESDYFAGRVLKSPINGGNLWICDICQSMFRHPVLTDSLYMNLYADGIADELRAGDGRQDFALVRQIIAENISDGSVLDVGCGGGDFLLTLPSHLRKFGVEPSLAAVAAARTRGVSILAPTLEGLPEYSQFDVITMLDVIEHLTHPAQLLDAALLHLAPGGRLIIATGDPRNPFWRRVFRSRFWYATFAEHITFPSRDFFRAWNHGRGLQPPQFKNFKYRRLPIGKIAIYATSQLVYWVSPQLLNLIGRTTDRLRHVPDPRRHFYSPGAPGLFTDHQIVTIQRRN